MAFHHVFRDFQRRFITFSGDGNALFVRGDAEGDVHRRREILRGVEVIHQSRKQRFSRNAQKYGNVVMASLSPILALASLIPRRIAG